MKVVASIWNDFWFRPSSATHLAFARVVFFTFVLYEAMSLHSAPFSELSRLVWAPVSFFELLNLHAPPAWTLALLDRILIVAAAAATLGLFTRTSIAVCAITGLYLWGLQNNFGKVNHGFNAAVFIVTFLAFSRCGDKWSVDALIGAVRGKRGPPTHSGEYTWPIRAVWLCLIVVYFSAGIAKVWKSGFEWALSDNLKWLLVRHHYSHEPPTNLGLWISQYDQLATALAAGSLFLELFCPLALLHRYLRYVFGLGLCGMQVGIWLMMGVAFKATIVGFLLFWLPWGTWIEWMNSKWFRRAGALYPR